MRVLYIGKCDSLAREIVNCFQKEGSNVCLLTDQDFMLELKPSVKHKVYISKDDYRNCEKYFINIKPEIVIFAGNLYLKEKWEQGEDTNLYLQQLLNVLNFSVKNEINKFIFLSSSHVLDYRIEKKTEIDPVKPIDYKGMMYTQAERMVSLWKTMGSMETVILRTDLVLGCHVWEETGNLTQKVVESFLHTGTYIATNNRFYSPVFIKDLVNVIFRCTGVTISDCYHAVGEEEISEVAFATLLNQLLENKYNIKIEETDSIRYVLSNERIKQELEWFPFYTIEETFQNGSISLNGKKKTKVKKKKKKKRIDLVAIVENMFLFALIASLALWKNNHSILTQLDLMGIYVMIAGLIFGMKQSVPSMIYACFFYLFTSYERQYNLASILTNVETLLQFTSYIFIGVATGYTVDCYKLKINAKDTEYVFLEKEYETIREINRDNLVIKQEYHKQLLNYNTSLPKLYSVISRLTVLEPERIFSETIHVVKDIMEVETVAVYLAKEGSSYMRLVVSSDEKSVFGGKSWNLNEYENIKEAFAKDEVFIGNTRNEKEPALAAPIYYKGICIAALVIKEVPFQFLNLYYTNLFRTMAVMITSSIVKAKDYENVVKQELFIPDSEIFYPIEFRKMIDIAIEKKQQGIAEFCMIKVDVEASVTEVYYRTANLFRNTDFFGMDDEYGLYVLLGNTSENEAVYVLERMEKQEISATIVSYDTLENIHFESNRWNEVEETHDMVYANC